MKTIQELEEILLKVKIELMTRSVFLSAVCLALKHQFTDEIPTAATNGMQVLYNPDFFADLSFEEQVFVVAHECWHPALDHFNRRGSREPRKWNYAGDHVINLQLLKDGYSVPKAALCDPRFKGMATEQVYLQIPDPPEDSWDLVGIDMHEPPPGMTPEEYKAKMHETIIKAKLQSEMSGKAAGEIPGEVARVIDKLLNPVVPWHKLMQRYMTEYFKGDFTWRKPNRRYLPQQIYMPSQHSPTIKRITVAVDTSGSVSQREFREMMTEVQALKDQFLPDKMEVIMCDSAIRQIHDMKEYGHVSDLKISGGGGTSIIPVLEYCDKNPPTCLIYFTDLHFMVPDQSPDYPILWICTSDHPPMDPEWGSTIYLRQ